MYDTNISVFVLCISFILEVLIVDYYTLLLHLNNESKNKF